MIVRNGKLEQNKLPDSIMERFRRAEIRDPYVSKELELMENAAKEIMYEGEGIGRTT